MRVMLALDEQIAEPLTADLEDEGHEVIARCLPADLADLAGPSSPVTAALRSVDVLLLEVTRSTLSSALIRVCDRESVRVVALVSGPDGGRAAQRAGLPAVLSLDASPRDIAQAIAGATVVGGQEEAEDRGRVVVVWGPHGAPGRSTIAATLAMQLARRGKQALLIDADTSAPSAAVALGLSDEGPGFAAACRQAARHRLDAAEVERLAVTVAGTGAQIDVLTGINRPSRWPELSQARVQQVLDVCRGWADVTVVDVGASLEQDEEIMSDLDAPRRHGATLGALAAADHVIAVTAADPVSISRLVRAHPDLRHAVGGAPVTVVANRTRPGPLGVDARGQVRRTLDRFAGVTDVMFVPFDQRAADIAMLSATTLDEAAPRSAAARAIGRIATHVVPERVPSSRAARRAEHVARRAFGLLRAAS